jgi:hypothetical protein
MMYYCLRALFVCLALGAVCLEAESVQEIADGIVFARGGRAKLQSIQTERISGQVLAGDQQGSFVMEVKRPNKIRLEISIGGDTVTKTYDGKTEWKFGSPGQKTPERITESQANQFIGETDIDGPFLDFSAKGTQIELLGKELLGSSLVWKLKVTPKAGTISYYYVESTGYLVLLREQVSEEKDGQQNLSQQFYQDFQRVQDVTFPFVVIAQTSISDEPTRLKCEKIELNIPESDDRFALTSASAK